MISGVSSNSRLGTSQGKANRIISLNEKVYLLTESNEVYRAALEQKQLAGLEFTDDKSVATIVIADPPLAAPCLEQFPQLEWLQSTFAGVV